LFVPSYHLSEKELGVLWEYLDHILAQGKIVWSEANICTAILFVPKPTAKLWLCVDYQGINVVTVKDSYLLLLMEEPRDQVVGNK
jgi:hypothetical protein